MSKSIQFQMPAVPEGWAAARETHPAVAMAIHAIADRRRSPQAIWESPTQAEWETVAMAVENYVLNDVFEAEAGYPWGQETVRISEK